MTTSPVTNDDVARAKAEEARAEAEVRAGGPQRRALPLLDQLRVASPCSAPWDEMVGTERARFCGLCEKTVYNVSAMTREEAEQFLSAATSPCVRFYQRADGTILTSDCPVGVSTRRKRNLLFGALATVAAAFAGLVGVATRRGTQVQGGMHPMPTPPPVATVVAPDAPTANEMVRERPPTVRMGAAPPYRRPPTTGADSPKPPRKAPATGGVIP